MELENNDLEIEHNVLEDSCEDCEKYFSRRQHFNSHVTTVQKKGPKEEKDENKGRFQGKVKGKFKTNFGTNSCKNCEKYLSRKQNVKSRVKTVHDAWLESNNLEIKV